MGQGPRPLIADTSHREIPRQENRRRHCPGGVASLTTRLRVHGTVRVPGDKSISHRALILSALARGSSRIDNILESADVQSTAEALRVLGASIPPLSPKIYV